MTCKSSFVRVKNEKLFPIGIGTWGIGGFAERDPQNDDEKQVKALKYKIQEGMNYVDICYWNSEGKAAELTAQAYKNVGVVLIFFW
jgi:aryl-alcohol dehydrogenase-like predicted oxidoreductase